MTPEDQAKLTAAGWIVVNTGFWRSPLTGHDFPERAALAVLNIRPRQYNPIYRRRFTHTRK